MKTKTQFTNRILSLALALMMVVGMLPMTAFAATEVSGWNTNMVAYSDGVTQYFTYNNYLYQVKYTNLKTVSETWISYDRYGNMILSNFFFGPCESICQRSRTTDHNRYVPPNSGRCA